MRALGHSHSKMEQKNLHGVKIGRPMSWEDEIDDFIQLWWRGWSKMKISHEIADSFTMQNAPATGDGVGKRTWDNFSDIAYYVRIDLTKTAFIGK